MLIKEIKHETPIKYIDLTVKSIDRELKEYPKKNGGTLKVLIFSVTDTEGKEATGKCFDTQAEEMITKLDTDTKIQIKNGWGKIYENKVEVSTGRFGVIVIRE